jgi:hypothetical protein
VRTIGIIIAAALIASCTPNQRIMQDSENRTIHPAPEGTPAPSLTDIEQDLKAMQDAQFLFVYVLRRKDGAPLDQDDRRYAGSVIPQEMNRRVVSDHGRAIVIGSNFRMPPDIQKVLAERFAFEDKSPAPQPQQNTPAR